MKLVIYVPIYYIISCWVDLSIDFSYKIIDLAYGNNQSYTFSKFFLAPALLPV